MTDRILLTGLLFHGRHGALAAEQQLGGRFVVDVEATLDLRPLQTSEAAVMMTAWLGNARISENLIDTIHRRARGYARRRGK